MSATRWNRARTLLAQPARTHAVFRPVAIRAPIQHHLGRTAAVATVAARTQDRWRPWMMASVATAGVLSWQLSQSLVKSESHAQSATVIDEDSKLEFPRTILSEDGSPARLLGLGVRKITFLKVQVYVVGLYAKASDLDDHNSRFRALPEVQKFQRTDAISSDAAFRAIVQNPIELVLRIAPVRNTNGPHLRDGFTRNLTQALKRQNLNDIENEEAMKGIIEFKNLFPKGKILAGQALLFRKSPDGSMSVELDGEVLGETRNTWLIESFFLGYLHGENPISGKARDSIAQGIQDLLLQ
ncbi:hypothetical protein KI688_011691 [Linnemannia hyalina]|uniref:Chalcone isomerase domain-containing protein n=1 Tax=Linnemannia hyalina TaxID=64524 RepID=A0A9P7XY96_9FUNG|nr:hypothetical protein KI688_011691 [Linnemannia hyalina]